MKDEQGKPDDKSKTGNESTKKAKSFSADFFAAAAEQATNEYTRPIIQKIFSEPVLSFLRSIGADKILPIIGMALGSIITKERFPKWGDMIRDVTSEGTAELRRLIKEEPDATGKDKATDSKKISHDLFWSLFLQPELQDEFNSQITALIDIMESRTDKNEKDALLVFLNQIYGMGPEKMIEFLSKDKNDRDKIITTYFLHFYKKKETSEDKINKTIKNLTESKEELRLMWNQVIMPFFLAPAKNGIAKTYKKFDDVCSSSTEVRETVEAVDAKIKSAAGWALGYLEQRKRR
jgi:hypothetical protein